MRKLTSCVPRQGERSDVAAGNPIQQGPISRGKNTDVIRLPKDCGNGAISEDADDRRRSKSETHMRLRLYLSALIAMSLIGASASAFAPGTGTVPPVGTPSTVTTGLGTGLSTNTNPGISEPGVPNTSTPGMFGTGASPSGLPGDDPNHPGFPARVGR
jgi:hypothetical protein